MQTTQRVPPLLSVIIPVYNAETFLGECLASVCSQSFANIEIICVDDGSTDKSMSILQEWQSKDKRILIIQQTNNGPSAARNRGIKMAKGEYITFVDADDIVCKDIYTKSFLQIKDNNLDIYFFAFKSFPDGSIKITHFPSDVVMGYHELFESNEHIQSYNSLCFNWRFIYKYSIIKNNHLRFDEQIRYGEDMIFNIDAICKSQRIMVSDEPLYLYRKNPSGAMSKYYKPHLEESFTKMYEIKKMQIIKYNLDKNHSLREDIADYCVKVYLPMLIYNDYRFSTKNKFHHSVKRILSLKMIQESLKVIGFKNRTTSLKEYLFYLALKFRLYLIVSYFYKKNIKDI